MTTSLIQYLRMNCCRIWTAGEPENDARVARTGQGGMKVNVPLQKNMQTLRDSRPGLKEKYPTLPFE